MAGAEAETEAAAAPTHSFKCAKCAASYVRQDHLHRHELSRKYTQSVLFVALIAVQVSDPDA